MYIVIRSNETSRKYGIQKLLHPLQEENGKIMSKVYQISGKFLVPIHKSKQPVNDHIDEEKPNE